MQRIDIHTHIYIHTCCRREYGPGEKFTKRGISIEAENHGDQILFSDVTRFRGMKAAAKPCLALTYREPKRRNERWLCRGLRSPIGYSVFVSYED